MSYNYIFYQIYKTSYPFTNVYKCFYLYINDYQPNRVGEKLQLCIVNRK